MTLRESHSDDLTAQTVFSDIFNLTYAELSCKHKSIDSKSTVHLVLFWVIWQLQAFAGEKGWKRLH